MLERLKKLRIAPIIQYIWSRTSDFFKKGDMFLLVMCCICTCFGITLVGSATKSYPSHTFVPIQVFAFILGLFLYYVLTVLDVSIIASRWKLLIGFETFLLLLLIPFGVSGDTGNSGWLRFFGIGIQPSEIVKVVFIVLMAKQISYLKEYKNLNSVLSILQLVVHFGYTFVLLMVTTKDLGSAIVFGAIFAVMLIVAGVRLYWFLIGGAAIALAIPFLWNNFLDEYQRLRILAPYDPSIDPDGWGITWQTTRSKYALMGGQTTGLGLGHGAQTQSGALTGKHTDFIFAVAGEELGMVACVHASALRCHHPLHDGGAALEQHDEYARVRRRGVEPLLPDARQHRHVHRHHARYRHHAPIFQLRRFIAHVYIRCSRPCIRREIPTNAAPIPPILKSSYYIIGGQEPWHTDQTFLRSHPRSVSKV